MLSAEYLAGLFDGEGNVEITNKGALRLGLSNTFREVLDLVQTQFGGSIKPTAGKKAKIKGWKVGYIWRPCGERARCFLKTIAPYSIIKHGQIEAALSIAVNNSRRKLTEQEKSLRVEIQGRIRELNSRGQRWKCPAQESQ